MSEAHTTGGSASPSSNEVTSLSHFGERLSVPSGTRIVSGMAIAFLAGMTLGSSHGGKMAGMRYRAENAHRLPQSKTGWYFYHKSKNYHVTLGALKEGFKMGRKTGLWTGAFLTTEALIDVGRGGKKDFLSSAAAGLSVSTAFSVWNGFPLMAAFRMAKTGLYGGLAFGILQDALGLARGRRPQWISSIVEILGFTKDQDEEQSL